MSGDHLSAEELQQYILDRSVCAPGDIDHLDNCPDCQGQVAAYTMLMEGLRQQPAPVFGFDVSAIVLRRLADSAVAGREVERGAERRTGLAMAALIIVAMAVPAWLFRKSAYYVFADFPAIFLYLILAAAGLFLALRIIHLIKRYQHIINIINK